MGSYHMSGGGPWGGGPRGGPPRGNGSGPRGRGPQPPNIEEMLRRGQDQLRRVMPGGFGSGKGILYILLAVIVIWGLTGLYRVLPDEQGVVLRFGKYAYTTQPGLHWRYPSPIETVLTPKVTRVNRLEVGFRAGGEGISPVRGGATQIAEEALMLT